MASHIEEDSSVIDKRALGKEYRAVRFWRSCLGLDCASIALWHERCGAVVGLRCRLIEHRISNMAKVHAQHAFAGNYHLETRYAAPKWEWFVLDATRPSKALFSGESGTLRAAMNEAAMRAGLYPEIVNWRPTGPEIEVPD